MGGASTYEQLEVELVLGRGLAPLRPGTGLVLIDESGAFAQVARDAIVPALLDNGLNRSGIEVAFTSDSDLTRVRTTLLDAEVIVADVTRAGGDLMYVLGFAHGLGRCPLLVYRRPTEPPFDLRRLRNVQYDHTPDGLRRLRADLGRAVRVFLAASRAMTPPS